MPESKRYILLPRKGYLTEALRELAPKVESFEHPYAPFVVKSKLAGGRDIRVIRSIVAHGPKLVELDDLAAEDIDRSLDVRRVPVIKYVRPLTKSILTSSFPLTAPPEDPGPNRMPNVKVKVMETKKTKWVHVSSGFVVTAISDVVQKTSTNSSGEAALWVSGDKIHRLCCERRWTWGGYDENLTKKKSIDLRLEPVSEDFMDCVRSYYGKSRFNPATGVTVGVIDTGVGPHDDLNIIGGRNLVEGEPPYDYQDVDRHGTFVGGLIGSRGILFPKLRGLAPGVPIRSYRVFGRGFQTGGENNALMDAIEQARSDKCDIVNVSIENQGEGPGAKDDALQEAVIDARDNGMLVVVAAGNDGRNNSIDYPAAYLGATAVSAMGCKGTFPESAMENMIVSDMLAENYPNEFIASFSNRGNQISVTALGVGVLSTLPGNSFGSCSGTSFAAPVVTGAIACLLSRNPDIYSMPRNRARSDAVESLLFANCIKRGFGQEYEGHGMPDPERV